VFKNYFAFTKSPALNFIIGLVISIGLLVGLGPLVISYGKELPFSILSFVVLFNAIWWGWQIGFLSTLIYIFIGVAGLGIFPNHESGLKHLFTITNCGYYFGFLAAALLAGYFAEIPRKKKMLNSLAVWFLGHALILLLGGLYIYRINPERAWAFIQLDFPAYAMKATAGLIITVAFLRFVEGRENFYKAS
jgi:biotin transport system substrate-specific component